MLIDQIGLNGLMKEIFANLSWVEYVNLAASLAANIAMLSNPTGWLAMS